MKIVTIPTLALGLALFAGACGDDEGGSSKSYNEPLQASEGQKQSAQTAVTSVDDLKGLAATDPGNEEALGKVTGVWGNLQNLTAAKTAAQAGQAPQGAGAAPGTTGLPGATSGGLAAIEGALTEGCYAQNGSAVTYNDCSFGTGTIDGTINYAEPTLDIDLTIAMNQGTQITIVEKGSLTIGADAITGQLSYAVDLGSLGGLGGLGGLSGAGGGDYSSTTTVDAMYDIQLTDGCPTGGTLEVHQVSSVSGVPGGAGAYDVWVKAEYGPACGDVTLF